MTHRLAINCSKENNLLLGELHNLASMKQKLNPQPSRVVIAQNIRVLREKRGLSQAALAKKAGVSQRTISNMENPESETTPTTDRVDAVARQALANGLTAIATADIAPPPQQSLFAD